MSETRFFFHVLEHDVSKPAEGKRSLVGVPRTHCTSSMLLPTKAGTSNSACVEGREEQPLKMASASAQSQKCFMLQVMRCSELRVRASCPHRTQSGLAVRNEFQKVRCRQDARSPKCCAANRSNSARCSGCKPIFARFARTNSTASWAFCARPLAIKYAATNNTLRQTMRFDRDRARSEHKPRRLEWRTR